MSQSLDGRLNLFERITLKLHLLACNWCKRYLEQIKLISDLFETLPRKQPAASQSLSSEARERISRNLQQHLNYKSDHD